jgi:hypothetical protein
MKSIKFLTERQGVHVGDLRFAIADCDVKILSWWVHHKAADSKVLLDWFICTGRVLVICSTSAPCVLVPTTNFFLMPMMARTQ